MLLNRDLMNMADVRASATSSMRVIDAIQDLPPELQVIAIVSTFRLLSEHYKINIADALAVSDNIMNHAQGRRVEFEAIRDYLEGEL